MSTTGSNSASTDPSSRFISETAIEDARREREAAWQKAYESGDASSSAPIGSEYDPRTLYERLKEQRQKKDESYAESRRFANQIKRLDPEETEFLESIDEHALEKQRAERQAEILALAKFKDQVAEKRQPPVTAASGRPLSGGPSKEGRAAAIAAIAAVRSRPKRTEPLEPEASAKRLRSDHNADSGTIGSDSPQAPPQLAPPSPPGDSALNALLASYGSDSDSGSDSGSDSEAEG
ncbi:hypothetical protein IWW47_000075 [Coemansia sp. RSA 2052]|nr:hypothetical protein IWW47_000075 [Coemansia sp. RSA 2052]